jgi:hypothetical protein
VNPRGKTRGRQAGNGLVFLIFVFFVVGLIAFLAFISVDVRENRKGPSELLEKVTYGYHGQIPFGALKNEKASNSEYSL